MGHEMCHGGYSLVAAAEVAVVLAGVISAEEAVALAAAAEVSAVSEAAGSAVVVLLVAGSQRLNQLVSEINRSATDNSISGGYSMKSLWCTIWPLWLNSSQMLNRICMVSE